MGLDMHLFRVKTIPQSCIDKMRGKTAEEIQNEWSNSLIFDPSKETGTTDLLPYAKKIEIIARYFDLCKIKECYNIPQDAWISGESVSDTEHHFSFCEDQKSIGVSIPNDEIKKFIFSRIERRYIVFVEELYYWQNAYIIQDAFYERFPIVNCGFHQVNNESLKEICEEAMAKNDFLELPIYCEDDEGIFYHEWY